MFVTNWNSTTKIQKISEITNFFRHYFLSRTEVKTADFVNYVDMVYSDEASHSKEISLLWQQYYIKK